MSGTRVSSCPICGGSPRPYCEKSSHGGVWQILKCRTCGHGFVGNPPSLERLNEIQSHLDADTVDSPEGSLLVPPSEDRENIVFASRMARLTSGRGKTLDVGCGAGSSTLCLAKHGFKPLVLIDFDPRAVGAVDHIPNSRFEQRAFETFTVDEGPFDVIIMSHVLEHSMQPLEWLEHARKLLSPVGILAIAVPNFGGVYRLLGERDPWLIPPIHLQYFTPASIRIALRKSGLAPRRIESRSGITLHLLDRTLSLRGKTLRRAWNMFSMLLNRTTRGITLWTFAGRDDAPSPKSARASAPNSASPRMMFQSLEERTPP